jgi:superfamily II DNA or RNA helicase
MRAQLTKKGLYIQESAIKKKYGTDTLNAFKNSMILKTKNFKNFYTTLRVSASLKDDGEKILWCPKGIYHVYKHPKTKKYRVKIPLRVNRKKAEIDITVHLNIKKPELWEIGSFSENTTEDMLYDNQKIVVDHLCKYVFTKKHDKRGMSHCTLVMGAGIGKSRTAIAIILRKKMDALIIAPNVYMLNQWYDELIACDINPDDIGLYYAKKKTIGKITVAVIDSILLAKDDVFSNIGFVVYDEIQLLCSKERVKVFRKVNSVCNLGLTATPDSRTDNFGKAIDLNTGLLVHASDIDGFEVGEVSFTGTVIGIRYDGKPEFTIPQITEGGTMSAIETVKKLCEDPKRQKLITKITKYLYDRGVNLYVFSELRDYADALTKSIHGAGVPVAIEDSSGVHCIMGGTSTEERDRALDKTDKSVIVTTYGTSSVGVSISKMTGMLFGTSRKSGFIQKVGRILRRNSDQSIHRIVIDFIDNCSPLKKQLAGRKLAYREYGFDYQEIRTTFNKKFKLDKIGDILDKK